MSVSRQSGTGRGRWDGVELAAPLPVRRGVGAVAGGEAAGAPRVSTRSSCREVGHLAGIRAMQHLGGRRRPRPRRVNDDDVGERGARASAVDDSARGRPSAGGSRQAVACAYTRAAGQRRRSRGAAAGVGGPASHGMIRGTEPRASLARGPTPGGRHTGRCVTLGVRGFGACGIDPEARGSASPGRRRRTGAAVREWGPVSSAMHLVRVLIGSSCTRGASSAGAVADSAAAGPPASSVVRDCLGGRDWGCVSRGTADSCPRTFSRNDPPVDRAHRFASPALLACSGGRSWNGAGGRDFVLVTGDRRPASLRRFAGVVPPPARSGSVARRSCRRERLRRRAVVGKRCCASTRSRTRRPSVGRWWSSPVAQLALVEVRVSHCRRRRVRT